MATDVAAPVEGTALAPGRAFVPAELDDYPLDPDEFRVYCRLLRRAGPRGATESSANIARGCAIGERRVREALALLRAAGLVTVDKRPGTTDRYWITDTATWAAPDRVAYLRDEVRRPTRRGDTGPPGGAAPLSTSVERTAVEATARSRGPDTAVEGTGHRGRGDRTPRSRGPDTAVEATYEGTPLKVLQEGSPSKVYARDQVDALCTRPHRGHGGAQPIDLAERRLTGARNRGIVLASDDSITYVQAIGRLDDEYGHDTLLGDAALAAYEDAAGIDLPAKLEASLDLLRPAPQPTSTEVTP